MGHALKLAMVDDRGNHFHPWGETRIGGMWFVLVITLHRTSLAVKFFVSVSHVTMTLRFTLWFRWTLALDFAGESTVKLIDGLVLENLLTNSRIFLVHGDFRTHGKPGAVALDGAVYRTDAAV